MILLLRRLLLPGSNPSRVNTSKTISLFIGTLATSMQLYAQWSGSLGLSGGYADNAFSNYLTAPASMYSGSLLFGYFPENGRWASSYSGSYNTFGQYADRNYSTHQLTASYSIPYGEEQRHALTFALAGGMRFDNSAFTMYDYRQAVAALNWKHVFEDLFSGKLGYRAHFRTYPNFLDLSYLEQSASLSLSRSFATKTSVSMDVSVGNKEYQSLSTSTTTSAFTASNAFFHFDDDRAKDPNHRPNFPHDRGIRGIDFHRDETQGIQSNVQYLVYEQPTTMQLCASLKIAQSLGEETGISARYFQRWNLTDRGRAFVGGAVDFIGEEDLFDDPYSYESKELALTLTRYLPFSLKGELSALYSVKQYPYPNNLDYTSSAPDRADTRFGLTVSLEKSMDDSWFVFEGTTLMVEYLYQRNQSNTAYYDYHSNVITLGIETMF